MLRIVGYVRVSTEDQHNGPAAQLDAIRAWCDRNGGELVAVFEDIGVSGAAPLDKRPGLIAAVDAVGRGGVLLAAKRDRLARDVIVAATVERLVTRSGGRVETADGAGEGDGPEALLMRRMIDAFAEYERQIIAARTRAALASKKARGERVGALPIGSTVAADGKHLAADAGELEALRLISELRADGLSLRGIADELNRRGVPARGARWHATTVARLVKRAAA